MKTTMKKLILVLAIGSALGGCAAPTPPQPMGPRVAVNSERAIEEFRAAEKERLRLKLAQEAEARAEAEQEAFRAAHLQYLQEKQRYLESLPRGLEPKPIPKRRISRKKPAPTAPAAAVAPAEAAPVVASKDPASAEAPKAKAEQITVDETRGAPPPVGPSFTPRRSAQ